MALPWIQTIWGREQTFDPALCGEVYDQDPLEPADHLDEKTKALPLRFPGIDDLLRSRYGESRTTDNEWFPARPLGQGGFGGVAVWERRNSKGDVIEETAVKQAKWDISLAYGSPPTQAIEAGLMCQLNDKSSENIVYLKNFKTFRDCNKRNLTWRFYFEHCPHGDLARLIKRYRAWGHYLPEEFLWRTMHSFALVAKVLEQGEYQELNSGLHFKPPLVLVHSDIKPQNGRQTLSNGTCTIKLYVFLGYENNPGSPWQNYPVIKVGDFGLAALTNDYDTDNPSSFLYNGTPWYLPPARLLILLQESRLRTDMERWQHPLFGPKDVAASEVDRADRDSDFTDRKVGSRHNIWGFGMTMWELITLNSPGRLSDHVNRLTEDKYYAWGENTIEPIKTHKKPEYDEGLRELVRKCLNLRPSLRPTVNEILDVTTPKLREYEERFFESKNKQETGALDGHDASNIYDIPRLYFRQNEINNMPLGPHIRHFGYASSELLAEFALRENQYAGPVWGPIRHPCIAAFNHEYIALVRQERQQQERQRLQEAERRRLENAKQQRIQNAYGKRAYEATGMVADGNLPRNLMAAAVQRQVAQPWPQEMLFGPQGRPTPFAPVNIAPAPAPAPVLAPNNPAYNPFVALRPTNQDVIGLQELGLPAVTGALQRSRITSESAGQRGDQEGEHKRRRRTP